MDSTYVATTVAVASSTADAPPSLLQCVVHLPLPDAAAAQTLLSVLSVDEAVADTQKTMQLRSDDGDDAERTVVMVLTAPSMRSLRMAVNAVLEQCKLIVRTMRAFPAL